MKEIQKKLNESILTPTVQNKDSTSKRNVEDLSRAVTDKLENDSSKRRRMTKRRSSLGAGGKGKDLQAMRARLDSRQNSLAGDLSSKGSKRPTTPGSQVSEQGSGSSGTGGNKGGKDLNQIKNRSISSSPGSFGSGGRGRGKDLESMRNRNNLAASNTQELK